MSGNSRGGGRGANAAARADEESPLVPGQRSPLSSARAAWFNDNAGGASRQQAQSYGAFVKSGNHGSMGTAASASGRDTGSSAASRLQTLREHWPVAVELLASYALAMAGFASHSHPWAVGLAFAGLAHASSTGGGYYLQANPVLTLGQLLRGHIGLPRAALYWSAQFLGVTLAAVSFSLTGPSPAGGHGSSPTGLSVMVPLTSCKSQHWGPALFLVSLFSSAWVYVALSAWDSMALALESCCTFYGLATGAAYGAAAASIQSRGVASALLNPWVGVLGLVNAAATRHTTAGAATGPGPAHPGYLSASSSSVACDALFILGPLLGCGLGVLLSWLTSLNGSEKEAFLRSISPMAPLLVETVGVIYLVVTLGSAGQGLTTGAMALALTLCAWRRSGAQFNPAITLTIFLLKRQMFRWTSLLFYILAHLAGALIGSCLLILLPLARDYPPVSVLDESVAVDARAALLLLTFSTAFLATFVANTDAEYDEGFLHPALMVGLTFAALVGALTAANDGGALQSGLFNPAVTLVLWTISRASGVAVVAGTLIQLLASALTFGFFVAKSQVMD